MSAPVRRDVDDAPLPRNGTRGIGVILALALDAGFTRGGYSP
jgi:hypothetical protein